MRSPLSHPPASREFLRGMTIVELLAVLGVIALLMSIIVPSLSAVRRNSRAVTCASNLRQIGLAHQMYMNVNRERFVDAGLSHGSSQGDLRRSWLMQLSPYMDEKAALRSPADRSRHWSIHDDGEHDGLTLSQAIFQVQQDPGAKIPNAQVSRWSSYAVNIFLTSTFGGVPTIGDDGQAKYQKWLRLPVVPYPDRTVHFVMLTPGDGVGSAAFARSDHVDTDKWINNVPPSKPGEALKHAAQESHMNAHGGRLGSWNAMSNYLYLDGRVELHPFSVVYENPHRNRFFPLATPSN